MRWTFELVNWIKQVILPNVHDPYPISWRSEKKKMTNSPATMMEFLLSDVISWGISFFLCSNTNWNIRSWISSLPTFGLQLDHELSWVSRLPTLGFGISQLPKSLEPVSEIHTHTHTHTHIHIGLLLPFSFMALPFLYTKTLSLMTYYILSSIIVNQV